MAGLHGSIIGPRRPRTTGMIDCGHNTSWILSSWVRRGVGGKEMGSELWKNEVNVVMYEASIFRVGQGDAVTRNVHKAIYRRLFFFGSVILSVWLPCYHIGGLTTTLRRNLTVQSFMRSFMRRIGKRSVVSAACLRSHWSSDQTTVISMYSRLCAPATSTGSGATIKVEG